MNQIELIKVEIKRLKKKYGQDSPYWGTGTTYDTLDNLLSFIESLEKEQDVDLEKEYNEQWGGYTHDGLSATIDRAEFEQIARHFYELGCRHAAVLYDDIEKERQRRCEKEPTIKGWVARDGVEDAFNGCGLILHHSRPWRAGGEWSNRTIAMHLPWEMFPDLKWADDPIEVELTIHRV